MSNGGNIPVPRLSRSKMLNRAVSGMAASFCLQLMSCHRNGTVPQPPATSETEMSFNCLEPEIGFFAPSRTWEWEILHKYALMPEGTISASEVWAYQDSASPSVMMLTKDPSGKYALEPRILKEDPVDTAERRIDAGMPVASRVGKMLLAAGNISLDVHTRPVDSKIAEQLAALWTILIRRVEQSNAKADVQLHSTDCTNYHFYQDGMAGWTAEPAAGSFLADVVQLLDEMGAYARGNIELGKLDTKVRHTLKRAQLNEPCLRNSAEASNRH